MNLIKALLLCFNIKMMREIGGNNFDVTESPDSKIFIVGIDDTICKTVEDNYKNSEPIWENIDFFNKLYDNGNKIHYWTSRGMKENKNYDKLTISQLKYWNVKYTTLNTNKPPCDYWISSKSINIKDI